MNRCATQFSTALVIAPGIWFPKYKNIESIEQMADVRAAIGVQWVLFNSAMDAARVVVEMVRKLQMLVGQVERVTEMLDLLEKVHENSREDTSANIADGESIKFEDVTIVTPMGNAPFR